MGNINRTQNSSINASLALMNSMDNISSNQNAGADFESKMRNMRTSAANTLISENAPHVNMANMNNMMPAMPVANNTSMSVVDECNMMNSLSNISEAAIRNSGLEPAIQEAFLENPTPELDTSELQSIGCKSILDTQNANNIMNVGRAKALMERDENANMIMNNEMPQQNKGFSVSERRQLTEAKQPNGSLSRKDVDEIVNEIVFDYVDKLNTSVQENFDEMFKEIDALNNKIDNLMGNEEREENEEPDKKDMYEGKKRIKVKGPDGKSHYAILL
jgi:hypothetical protein